MPKTIIIKPSEFWNSAAKRFVYTKGCTFVIEHSLVSVSKWESKWHKPFLTKETKTREQILDYIKCMTITQNIPDEMYNYLSDDNIKEINDYVEDSMTATWFGKTDNSSPNRRPITSELIYCWMINLQIPFECQKWHLNRLMTLIRVCGEESKQPKKLSKSELSKRNASLNEARLKKYHTSG